MHNIGILTFHRASNYGASLQAYALCTYLNQSKHSAEIIDYYCEAVEVAHNPSRVIFNKKIFKGLRQIPNKIKKYRRFSVFRNKLKLGVRANRETISMVTSLYEVFIVGSDQVWNPEYAGKDKTFLLDFSQTQNKYSYAASFGNFDFTDVSFELYFSYLERFKCISVRERSAAEHLERFGIHARVDVDPVFLLSKEEWCKLAKFPDKKKYILVYTVQPPLHLLDYARRLSEKTGCEIIYLNNEHHTNTDIKHIRFASPEEFVGWIICADYVLTNSFHGTAFSIIYNKKFKVELDTKKKRNTRSEDMIMSCGLKDSILKNEEVNNKFDYNWDNANKNMNQMTEESKRYLDSIEVSNTL